MSIRSSLATGCLAISIVASGAAALTYEIALTRSLSLFLGHDGYSALVVLVAFMGGLALGNALIGRWVDRWLRRPFLAFAMLEGCIGLYALVFPFLLSTTQSVYPLILGGAGGSPGFAQFALKLLVAAATVLPMTFLMGGTLPVLLRPYGTVERSSKNHVARCYALNSLGAVVGCLGVEFVLIPNVGIRSSIHAAALLNFVVAFTAYGIGWMGVDRGGETNGIDILQVGKGSESIPPSNDTWPVLWVASLSGFAGMLYEVAWMRLLALTIGSTAHAFALMLATFICGIALGSGWVASRPSSSNGRRSLRRFQTALALFVALSLPVYSFLPYLFARMAVVLHPDPAVYPIYAAFQGIVCILVMLVPTFLMGTTLPVAAQSIAPGSSATGAIVGRLFAWNTVGAVGGALVTSLVLLPALGLAGTFGVGVGINLAAALVLLYNSDAASASSKNHQHRFGQTVPPGWGRWHVPSLARSLSILCVLILVPMVTRHLFSDDWRRTFTLGLLRNPGSLHSYREFRQVISENRLTYYRDGADATVSVNAWNDGTHEQLNLRVNGKPDASTAGDMATQLLLGHLPMLLHSHATRALVIGLGSGVTSGAIIQYPSLQHLDTVEISPEVVEAARLFADWNHQVLDHPRMRLSTEDARSFLLRPHNHYDIIVSEPSNPWITGVAGLFTREFYLSCRGHLADGGLMVQWVHLYDNQQEALDLVLRTMSSVFAHVSLWQSQTGDVLLIASDQAQGTDVNGLLERMAIPAIHADLARIGLSRPISLLAREMISDANGRWLVDPAGVRQEDDHPRLEYLAQAAFFAHQEANQWTSLDEKRLPRGTSRLSSFLKTHPLSTPDYRELARGFQTYGLPSDALLRSLRVKWQADPTANGQLDQYARLPPLGTVEELEALRLSTIRQDILAKADSNRELAHYYLDLLVKIYRDQRSVFWLPPAQELQLMAERMTVADPENRASHLLLLAGLAWDRGDTLRSLEHSRAALTGTDWPNLARQPDFAPALTRYLSALLETAANAEARSIAEKLQELAIQDPALIAACRRASSAK